VTLIKKSWGRRLSNNLKLSSSLKRLLLLAGISVCLYAINRLVVIPIFPEVGFFKKYLADILALPAYLPLSVYLAWRLHLIPDPFKFHPVHIFGAGIIFSVLFEGIIPLIDSTSISDPIDVLSYFAGGLVVYLVGISGENNQKMIIED